LRGSRARRRALSAATAYGVLLGPQSDPTMRDRLAALREALGALGWVETRNFHLDYRFMNNSTDTNAYAAELVKSTNQRTMIRRLSGRWNWLPRATSPGPQLLLPVQIFKHMAISHIQCRHSDVRVNVAYG
jgi:hypothetical protein